MHILELSFLLIFVVDYFPKGPDGLHLITVNASGENFAILEISLGSTPTYTTGLLGSTQHSVGYAAGGV
jgi:hypothetical protein